MATMTTYPDLVPESWLALSQLHQHDHHDDIWIWNKLDIDQERALMLSNPASTESNLAALLDMGNLVHNGASVHPMGALPTPPHSPPTEHDLDDLVASIPEILESPSASPPSAISEILSDLEGMEATPSPSRLEGAWGTEWWVGPLPTPAVETSIKRDIMWGGGACNNNNCHTGVEIKKERQVSECSSDAAVIRSDDLSDDSDSDDNMPDTPSGSDSDCDDQGSETWSSPSPRSTATTTTPHHHHHHHHVPPSVNSEHNYCGRVPEPHQHHHPAGTITPSDTEDEVDVVSCPEHGDAASRALASTATSTTITTTRLHLPPPKRTVDVKRQLQLAIQEAMRNRQNKSTAATATATPGEAEDATSRLVSVKIKTQGKPAAYTKRMRDYHSEVVKSTKHRRRNRGENDEGRRSVHNSLERQRRVDLRNAFEYLRQLVPDTKILEKAPKVQILKKAAMYCKNLQQMEQRLLREKEKLKKQIEDLQQRKALSS